jgi:hypothetical protein
MEIKKNTSDYLINLLRAAIREEVPQEKPADVDWDEVLKLAVYHQVEELAFYSVSRLQKKPEGEAAQRWLKQHRKNQIVNMVQQAEAEEIIREATAAGIDILELKGAVMKNIYPKPEFRQMGDLDYLVNAAQIDEMKPIMESLGYSAEDVGFEDSHDVYVKLPYMEVEVHRRLLPPTEENHWHTDNIWERLLTDKDNQHLRHMTWEDYYLFHLLHFEKHYSMGGSGIKAIVDQYYLMKKYRDTIDWDKINRILPKMNYVEFEQMCQDLAEVWFGEGEMTEKLAGPAEYIINSGAFGTFEQYQKWSYERYQREQGIKTKRGFFFRRMFMERERMEFIYPSLKKHGWLLPFCWIHRLFKAVLFNRGRVKMEIDNFKGK